MPFRRTNGEISNNRSAFRVIHSILIIISSWDSYGLKNHKNELLLTLQEKRIDVVLISETHFTNNSYVDFPGYHSYHANHPDNIVHAGAAIYITSSLTYTPLPNYIISDEIQSCAISLVLNNIPIKFAAICCPPKHSISLTKFTDFFSTLNNNYIVGDDLNAKHIHWGCRTTNPKGNSFLQSLYPTHSTIIAPPN